MLLNKRFEIIIDYFQNFLSVVLDRKNNACTCHTFMYIHVLSCAVQCVRLYSLLPLIVSCALLVLAIMCICSVRLLHGETSH